MKQFLLPADYGGRGRVTLSDRDFHYLIHVRRLVRGERFTCRLGDGSRVVMVVEEVRVREVQLSPVSEIQVESESSESIEITLLQCMPKGRKLDQIVRQAVEIGVSRIIPVVSQNTVVRLTAEDRDRGRSNRLQRVAREAFQQSGASRLPTIEEPVSLSAIQGETRGVSLFLHEQRLPLALEAPVHPGYSPAGRVHAPHTQGSLHRYLADEQVCVRLLVGPEGGLSTDEVARLIEIGFLAVYLGDAVLRVETAAVFALGAIRTVLLERNSWTIARQNNQR